MAYKLSEKNTTEKQKYEKIIAKNEAKYQKIYDEIRELRNNKELNAQERSLKILEKQIQLYEIDRDIVTKKQTIDKLYSRQMEETLNQKYSNNELSSNEYANEVKNLREYRSMANSKNAIEDYDNEATILEMKQKLEYMKKSMGLIDGKEADRNIAEIGEQLADNEEFRRDEENSLAEQKFKYDRRNLYYQRNSGEITNEELTQKEGELEEQKGKVPSDKDFNDMFNNLSEKYLEHTKKTRGKETAKTNEDQFIPPSKDKTIEMLSACKNLSARSELDVNSYISGQAKKLGIDKQKLIFYLREQEKLKIKSPEKVLHYHRTSLERGKNILESGYLLNRKNMQLNGGDISEFRGSSSNNVQFSVDKYNEYGELLQSGYEPEGENLGASSNDIVFVMGPKLLKEETYNPFTMYPTVEKANINEMCTAILAKDPETLQKLQSILDINQINVQTMLQDDFDREEILQSLNEGKRQDKTVQASKDRNTITLSKDVSKEAVEQAKTAVEKNENSNTSLEEQGYRIADSKKKVIDKVGQRIEPKKEKELEEQQTKKQEKENDIGE